MNQTTDVYEGPEASVPSMASFRERVARLIWGACWLFCFRFTPSKSGRYWRNALLRAFGAKVGRCMIYPSVRVFAPWRVRVGDWTCIGPRTSLYGYGEIVIGPRSVISQDSCLCTSSHDYTLRSLPPICARIEIGERVWIAAQAFIMPGVKVGDGAVVGACSVVTKDVETWTVVGGNPARVLKQRKLRDA